MYLIEFHIILLSHAHLNYTLHTKVLIDQGSERNTLMRLGESMQVVIALMHQVYASETIELLAFISSLCQ